jgi:hypothetical protein
VNLLKNGIGVDQAKALVSTLKKHPTLKSLCGNTGNETELDMSGKMRGASDDIMLVAEIIDNGAILSLNLASNNLSAEDTKVLAEALKANPIMTELNHSDNAATFDGVKYGEMSGIVALAEAIPDMRVLLVLSLKSNRLFADGGKALAEGLKGNQVIQELNIATNYLGMTSSGDTDMSGVIALADAIPDSRALTSLNPSFTYHRAVGARHIAEAIKVPQRVIAVVVAPFPCPSDHWLNCCCLLISTG